jgi:predicted nucleotidyltransferase
MIEMDRIAEAVARIVQEFSPQQSVLFGSYSYGTPTEDSDVDLLVILPFAGNHIHKAIEILQRIDPAFPVDLLARTPEAVSRRLEWNDFFLREVIEKGRVLYAAPDGGMGSQSGGRLEVGAARVASA